MVGAVGGAAICWCCELEPLSDGFNVLCGIFGGWGGLASEVRSGGSVG